MKSVVLSLAMVLSTSAIAANFSPESFLGTLVSKDKKAKVRVYKEIVKEADLFNPAVYEYFADISFDGGPCFGGEQISRTGLTFRYNGSQKPLEYLSTGFYDDVDYDGVIFMESVGFTATKNKNNLLSFDLEFELGHNPDFGDGEDGGVSDFEACSKKTISSWKLTKK